MVDFWQKKCKSAKNCPKKVNFSQKMLNQKVFAQDREETRILSTIWPIFSFPSRPCAMRGILVGSGNLTIYTSRESKFNVDYESLGVWICILCKKSNLQIWYTYMYQRGNHYTSFPSSNYFLLHRIHTEWLTFLKPNNLSLWNWTYS